MQFEDAIIENIEPAMTSDFTPAGPAWRGVVRGRRYWPHPRLLLDRGIPVLCAIQEPGTGVFTAAGYIHWGYAVPFPVGGHSFAVAWNTYPRCVNCSACARLFRYTPTSFSSACFAAAAAFRVMQRDFTSSARATPAAQKNHSRAAVQKDCRGI